MGRKRRLVRVFLYLLLLQLFVSVASGGYYLYEIFKADSCSDLAKFNTDGDNFVDACNGSLKRLRIGRCVWSGVTWFFQYLRKTPPPQNLSKPRLNRARA